MIGLDEGGRARHDVTVFRAPPTLGDWVELLWIDSARPRPCAGAWRIVPDASAHLIVTVADGPASALACNFVGPRSTYFDSERRARRLTCGVRFLPGALSPLLRLNVRPLADRALSVETLAGRAGRDLLDRLAAAEQPAAIVELLTDFVERIAVRADPIDRRVVGFTARKRTPRVALGELARAQGVCERTLRTVVTNAVGLSPKRVARVRRVNHALQLTMTGRERAATIAGAAGFHDQSHMLREFRALLGETPRRFLTRGRDLPIRPRRR